MPRLVAVFSTLLPLTEADLWGDGPAKQAPTPVVPAPAPAASPAPATAASVAPALAAPVLPSAAPTPPPKPEVSDVPDPVPLHEKLKATQPATSHLAEALRHSAHSGPTPLAERAALKVGSLREAISINQRFSFINELFNGENTEYHAAIEHLDALPTADAAMAYVRQELAQQHDWSRKEEHVGRLLKLIERKFATA